MSSAPPLGIPIVQVSGPPEVYTEIDSDDWPSEESEEEIDEDTMVNIIMEAQEAFTAEQIDAMEEDLKEIGLFGFIRKYVVERQIPIRKLLLAFGVLLPAAYNDPTIGEEALLPLLRVALARILRQRAKLPNINTIDDVVHLLRTSQRIIVLSGAGISVSCGIPDFRSSTGIYQRLRDEGTYELDDPQQMFDKDFFLENPSIFYSFAKEIFPSNFTPSPCHRFIKLLENKGKLLRNYTQNIDTLETACGIKNVLPCHGSFAQAACVRCGHTVDGADIKEDIMACRVPACKVCTARKAAERAAVPKAPPRKKRKTTGWNSEESESSEEEEQEEGPPPVMKPCITFFGEKLPSEFDRLLFEDREKVDLLVVIGTSLKVAPVSEILAHLPHSIPQILINKTPVQHFTTDITLLGDADEVIHDLCSRLDWQLPEPAEEGPEGLRVEEPAGKGKTPEIEHLGDEYPKRVAETHIWLYPGADGGKYIDNLLRPRSRPGSRASSLVRSGPSLGTRSRSGASTPAPSESETSVASAPTTAVPSVSNSPEIKRRRGRPPKPRASAPPSLASTSLQPGAPAKRPRGRPRKYNPDGTLINPPAGATGFSAGASSAAASMVTGEAPPKRPRGRPRKYPLPTSTAPAATAAPAAPALSLRSADVSGNASGADL